MKITSNQLRRIIKQEVRRNLTEGMDAMSPDQLATSIDGEKLVSVINRAFPGVSVDLGPGVGYRDAGAGLGRDYVPDVVSLGVYIADMLGMDVGE